MCIDVRLLMPAVLSLGVAMTVSGFALAQSTAQACIQQGYKPGTAGFYHCLSEGSSNSGSGSLGEAQSSEPGEPESILGGSPENAVTDYTGSTMSGATSPDPDILKQLNAPRRAPR
jgi:hypothetical protein